MSSDQTPLTPRAFISYSWSTPSHKAQILEWAERLRVEGVDVILDEWDFKEGHDKFAFMEQMVTDPSVTHVLVFSDETYAQKADARHSGVGTETQIISRKVYESVTQSKFIPIVCAFDESGEPFLPEFLKSRRWIDFSSLEKVNENWERLVRVLYGKPIYEKPALGKPPVYIQEASPSPATEARAKYATLKHLILSQKPGVVAARREFISACISYADEMRIRKRPTDDNFGERVFKDVSALKAVRNLLIDWVLLECSDTSPTNFSEQLSEVLEKLLELKSRPSELNEWQDQWFEAQELFVYETFLYLVAALLKCGQFAILREIFTTHYLQPPTEVYGNDDHFDLFDCFYAYSRTLNPVLASDGKKYISAAAELIRRQSDRSDLPFTSIMEADALIFLMSLISENTRWWPATLLYATYSRPFPLFLRASQHKGFQKLAIITGIEDAEVLKAKMAEGHVRLNVANWNEFRISGKLSIFNSDKWDTLS